LNNDYGAYSFSKAMLTALTRIQQKKFDEDTSRPDIVVNAICPGYVGTDMTQYASGTKTTQDGLF
jgi:carbonyl reductase 1